MKFMVTVIGRSAEIQTKIGLPRSPSEKYQNTLTHKFPPGCLPMLPSGDHAATRHCRRDEEKQFSSGTGSLSQVSGCVTVEHIRWSYLI